MLGTSSLSLRQFARRGFTLIELLIAVGITALLLFMLVNLVASAADSWRLGRARLATNSEARTALDTFAQDMQSSIARSSPPDAVWLEVSSDSAQGSGEVSAQSQAIRFFSPVIDRETVADDDNNPNTPLAGDICGVSYRVAFQDPLEAGSNEMNMFALYREIRGPKDTFDNLIGSTNLATEWGTAEPETDDYLAGDILDLAVSFIAETATGQTVIIPPGATFRLTSEGIITTLSELSGTNGIGARLTGAQVNITVLDEGGAELIRQLDEQSRSLSDIGFDTLAEFIQEHGYQFSQQIPLYSGF